MKNVKRILSSGAYFKFEEIFTVPYVLGASKSHHVKIYDGFLNSLYL